MATFQQKKKTLAEIVTTLMCSEYQFDMSNIEVMVQAYLDENELDFEVIPNDEYVSTEVILNYDGGTKEYFFDKVNRTDVNLSIVTRLVDECITVAI